MMAGSHNHSLGFTLMELLIAIAVFVVMAAMAYGGLSSVLQTRRAVSAALDRSADLQLAVWRLRRDLEQIVDRPVRDRLGGSSPALLGTPDTGLALTRNGWRNPLRERRSHLQRVAYRVDEDDNLIRDYWRVLDQAQDSAPVESTLLHDVEDIEWRYLDRQREYQDSWPPNRRLGVGDQSSGDRSRQPFQPPLAIELRLTTRTWGELRLMFIVPGARP